MLNFVIMLHVNQFFFLAHTSYANKSFDNVPFFLLCFLICSSWPWSMMFHSYLGLLFRMLWYHHNLGLPSSWSIIYKILFTWVIHKNVKQLVLEMSNIFVTFIWCGRERWIIYHHTMFTIWVPLFLMRWTRVFNVSMTLCLKHFDSCFNYNKTWNMHPNFIWEKSSGLNMLSVKFTIWLHNMIYFVLLCANQWEIRFQLVLLQLVSELLSCWFLDRMYDFCYSYSFVIIFFFYQSWILCLHIFFIFYSVLFCTTTLHSMGFKFYCW